MMGIFADTFCTTFKAVLEILIVAFAAGLLVRKNIISQSDVKAISALTVKVLLPCLTFASIVRSFYPEQLHIWPVLPLSAVAMIALGLMASTALFAHELPQKKNMLSLASIQNAGYFVLPIGSILFYNQFEEFKLYCFLYILGLSPILWSLGKYLVSSDAETKTDWRELITPPFMASLLGITVVFAHIRNLVPPVLLDSIELVGSATVPIATFILGAVLGGISFSIKPHLFDAIRVTAVKMILIPLSTIAVLYLAGTGKTYPLLASFLVIEAAYVPATATAIQIKHYGGDEQKVGSIILFTYLFCIISTPFWVAIWNVISH